MKKKIKILSRLMALLYLYNEFGKQNLKVTTYLDEDGCWVGKVLIEVTEEKLGADEMEFAQFYANALCEETKRKVED